MYVCLCHAVTDRQIRQAVCAGACSMRQLSQELGVNTQCGKCGKCAQQVLKNTLAELGDQGQKAA
ncbi:MAG: bacterioferritin-associated ferredoxin [Gammaproteobacteria bacterium]|nr:bacterioferritin-associated ferredoxin [Gammaproteobacteria bacterium]